MSDELSVGPNLNSYHGYLTEFNKEEGLYMGFDKIYHVPVSLFKVMWHVQCHFLNMFSVPCHFLMYMVMLKKNTHV